MQKHWPIMLLFLWDRVLLVETRKDSSRWPTRHACLPSSRQEFRQTERNILLAKPKREGFYVLFSSVVFHIILIHFLQTPHFRQIIPTFWSTLKSSYKPIRNLSRLNQARPNQKYSVSRAQTKPDFTLASGECLSPPLVFVWRHSVQGRANFKEGVRAAKGSLLLLSLSEDGEGQF